jgi:thioredoxin 1
MSAFKDLINGSVPVIVHMSAEWAKPSEILSQTLRDVKAEMGEQVKMIKIDIDKNPDVASKFQVVGVPTLLLFREGVIKWRNSGIIEKEELFEIVNKHQ